MALRLDKFDRSPSRLTTFLGGVSVDVRSLTAAEMDALRGVILKPSPEMVANPIIGGIPAMIPDDFSPNYNKAMERWVSKMQTAIVAVAADLEAPGGVAYSTGMSERDLKAYVDAIVPEMRKRFTDSEIGDAYALVGTLSDPTASVDGKDRIEAAKKNLSGLSPSAWAELVRSLGSSQNGTESPSNT